MINFLKLLFNSLNRKDIFFLIFTLSVSILIAVLEASAVFQTNNIFLDKLDEKQGLNPLLIVFFLSTVIALLRIFSLYISSLLSILFCSALAHKIASNISKAPLYKQLTYSPSEKNTILITFIDRVGGGIITPVIYLVTSSLAIFGILYGLLIINKPIIFILIAALGSAYIVISYISKIKIKKLASLKAKSTFYAHEYANIISTYPSQLSSSGIGDFFVNRYRDAYTKRTRSLFLTGFFQGYPRYAIEFTVYFLVTLCIIIFGYFLARNNINDIFVSSSIFVSAGYAGYKLLPNCQQAYFSWSQILAVITECKELLKWLENSDLKEKKSNYKIFNEPLNLRLKNLSIKFQNKRTFNDQKIIYPDFNFINGLNFISGESGSGKSSLLEIICSASNEFKGELILENLKGSKVSFESFTTSYLDSKPFLFNASIKDNILVGRDVDPILFRKVLDISCLNKFLSEEDLEGPLLKAGEILLSQGQCQRIGIARTLLNDVNAICFDETFSGIDKQTCVSIFKKLKIGFPNKIFIIAGHQSFMEEISDNTYKII